MNIFSFLQRRDAKQPSGAMTVALPVANPQTAEEVVTNDDSVSKEANKPLTVSYATGWPIDVIYGYLHKNYEEKGFNDAMIKSDLAFRNMNMQIIRNKILMVFREINLNYDVMKHDLQNRMDTCSAAGLLSTVSDLEKRITIINAHKAELAHLEDEFRNNKNEASIPLQSYECGFLRGIATIAMGGVGNTSKSVVMPSNESWQPAKMVSA